MNLDNLDLRRRPDSNRGIAVLQTAALPLGYAALYNDLNRLQLIDFIGNLSGGNFGGSLTEF